MAVSTHVQMPSGSGIGSTVDAPELNRYPSLAPHQTRELGRNAEVERCLVCLLPVQGSDTQWYKNVLKNPRIRIDARGVGAKFQAVPITDDKAVKSVAKQFRAKYGAKDVKKYYSKFDVAVAVERAK